MSFNASQAGPSRPPRKPNKPFVAADNRPEQPDGIFRVLLISTGSVASIKMPDIVGALSKDPSIALQVVATPASTHFYTQEAIDSAVIPNRTTTIGSVMYADSQAALGVQVWRDEDEWSDWKKVGDPILHIELRRWADIVMVAPCSADFLAKLAAGFCDNLALSIMRALPRTTPVILCPAMNTHMYEHPFTADHLKTVQDRLGYMISGPQGAGTLACGDAGVGKMTDWRDVVSLIQEFASIHRSIRIPTDTTNATTKVTAVQAIAQLTMGLSSNNSDNEIIRPTSAPPEGKVVEHPGHGIPAPIVPLPRVFDAKGVCDGAWALRNAGKEVTSVSPFAQDGRRIMTDQEELHKHACESLSNQYGGDGKVWERKLWFG